MVEVQQKTFATIQESKTAAVVVEEGEQGASYDIRHTEAAVASLDRDLGTGGRVTVHVIEIAAQRGIGVVQKGMSELAGGARHLYRGVRTVFLKLSGAAANQAQLGIGVESAVANPAAQEEILARNPEALDLGLRRQGMIEDLSCQFWFQSFVGIELQNPVAGRFVHGGVLLRGEALPGFTENLCPEGACDLDSAIGRAGIDHDDLASAVADERPHAFKRGRKIGLFVLGDQDDGKRHGQSINWRALAGQEAPDVPCHGHRPAENLNQAEEAVHRGWHPISWAKYASDGCRATVRNQGLSVRHPLDTLGGAMKMSNDVIPFRAQPMLATLVSQPFDRAGWVYEEKYDGYRILAYKEGSKVTLLSRNDKDRSDAFPGVVDRVAHLKQRTVLLDGEVIAFDRHKVSRFQLLQQGHSTRYAVFDCLYSNGTDLRQKPLEQRRQVLEDILPKDGEILISRRLASNGFEAFRLAKRRGFEGIVAKDNAAPYVGRRSTSWLKVKVHQEEEFVIGGFTRPEGSRQHLGALLLGAYDRRRQLRYVGKVGTGFTRAALLSLSHLLTPTLRHRSAFADPPPARGAIFVAPKLVAQIAFQEWTSDRRLRQPVYLGLRDDKRPQDCLLPISVSRRLDKLRS